MRQKEDPELAQVPVLVVTAIGATAGIDGVDVLHKPVDVDALLRAEGRMSLRCREKTERVSRHPPAKDRPAAPAQMILSRLRASK
jgi:hypothetical protein